MRTEVTATGSLVRAQDDSRAKLREARSGGLFSHICTRQHMLVLHAYIRGNKPKQFDDKGKILLGEFDFSSANVVKLVHNRPD